MSVPLTGATDTVECDSVAAQLTLLSSHPKDS